MINSYKYRSNCSSYIIREDHYGASVYGGGGVGPIETCFYSQKDNFVRDRQNGGFCTSQCEHIASEKLLFRNRDNPVGAYDCSLFGVAYVDGKVGVGTRTTHLNSQKVGCFIDGGDFVSSRSSEHLSMIHSYQDRSYSSLNIRGEDHCVAVVYGRGIIGPREIHFSSQKF